MHEPLTNEELNQLTARNRERKKLKAATTPGPWGYESFAYVCQPESPPRARRMGILVRPQQWFDDLQDRYGDDVLDRGRQVTRPWGLQPYKDALYIAKARSDVAEKDIDLLIAEVRRLQKFLKRA